MNMVSLTQVEKILLMNRLLSLLNGARLQPIETPTNPTGYSPAQTIYIDNIPFKLQAEDAQKYDYDHERCFPYLFHAFDRSVYYLSQVSFHTQDPILVYTDMKSYFNGHAGKDISRINRQITDFKVDPNVSIQQDVVRLDDLFRELDFTMSGVVVSLDLGEIWGGRRRSAGRKVVLVLLRIAIWLAYR